MPRYRFAQGCVLTPLSRCSCCLLLPADERLAWPLPGRGQAQHLHLAALPVPHLCHAALPWLRVRPCVVQRCCRRGEPSGLPAARSPRTGTPHPGQHALWYCLLPSSHLEPSLPTPRCQLSHAPARTLLCPSDLDLPTAVRVPTPPLPLLCMLPVPLATRWPPSASHLPAHRCSSASSAQTTSSAPSATSSLRAPPWWSPSAALGTQSISRASTTSLTRALPRWATAPARIPCCAGTPGQQQPSRRRCHGGHGAGCCAT